MKIIGALVSTAATLHISFFPLAEQKFSRLVDESYRAYMAEVFAANMVSAEQRRLALQNLGPNPSPQALAALSESLHDKRPQPNLWQRYVIRLKEEGARRQLLAAGEYDVLRFAQQFGGLSGFCSQGGAHSPYHHGGATACHAFTCPTRRHDEWLPKDADDAPQP